MGDRAGTRKTLMCLVVQCILGPRMVEGVGKSMTLILLCYSAIGLLEIQTFREFPANSTTGIVDIVHTQWLPRLDDDVHGRFRRSVLGPSRRWYKKMAGFPRATSLQSVLAQSSMHSTEPMTIGGISPPGLS